MAKKKFIHLFPNYTNWQTVVTIDWQPFVSYNQFLQKSEEDQSDGYFYKIVGKRGNLYRLLYIGMTYKQTPTKRLKQHEEKINQLKEENKGYAIQVSMGNIQGINRKYIEHHYVKEIESLLIYAHSEFPYLVNKDKKYSHRVTRPYKIINQGELLCGLYKVIFWDMFVEE